MLDMSTLTVLKERIESLSGTDVVSFRQDNYYPETDGIWTEFVKIYVVPSKLFKSVYCEDELTETAEKIVSPDLQPSDMIRCRIEFEKLTYPKLFFDEEIPREELDERYDSSTQYLRRTIVAVYPKRKIAEEASQNMWYKYGSVIPVNILECYGGKRKIYRPRSIQREQPETNQEAQRGILDVIRGFLPAR
jgi:hypothetical protein